VDTSATEEWNAATDIAIEEDVLKRRKLPTGMVNSRTEGLSRAFSNAEVPAVK
jgi:hypothetical protein